MWCTGIICSRSFNLNHNSGHPKLLNWLTLRIRTSVCGDWMTSRLSVLAAYLACNIILVSASSWLDQSAWTSLHWPLVTVTAFPPSLKPPPITNSFCGGSWCSPSLQSAADRKLHRLTWYWKYVAHIWELESVMNGYTQRQKMLMSNSHCW